jgi:ATP-dependent helicase HrpB
MSALPIDAVLPELLALLAAEGQAVLAAPPGAGKTTRVPLALLDALPAGRILLLEPRRIAARAAAERMAELLGEAPGRRVGWRIRGEAQVSPATRIEVVTEGILTRMIQSAPDLPGVACVIFDEFHERSIHADLGLALALEVRGALRPDLRLIVMSATLDTGPVAALMGARTIAAEGRSFPVETRWLDRPRPAGERFGTAMAALIREALARTEGGLLAFLPGEGEIRRVAALLAPALPPGTVLQPLYGAMPLAAQRAAIAPLPGARKLVLATAIAETSLTIPDIRVVVDGGLARRARFDPGSGMGRLVTERVSRAEAEQRRGRAGRVAPGVCFRLWTRAEEGGLAAFPPPEIATADLAGLALDLAAWGARASDLPFLTPPPAPALAEAAALLGELGALDPDGRITAHGRALAALPLHPRLGHMLVRGAAEGARAGAARLAALLEDRDPLRGAGTDIEARLAALADPARAPAAARGALGRIGAEAARLACLVPASPGPGLSPGALLSLAFPDRIGLRRPGGEPRYLLAGGRGAILDPHDPLATQRMIVAADLDGGAREARVRLAAAVAEAEIRSLHAARLATVRRCEWSRRDRAAAARERLMLGAIALEDRSWSAAPPEAAAAALLEGIADLGLGVLPWTDAARRLAARVEFLRRAGEPLPEMSEAGLLARLGDWLGPFLGGLRRIDDLARLDLAAILAAGLDRTARQRLDALAPATIAAPTGTTLPIDWSGPEPKVSVRLQEMFGTRVHPTVGPDRRPLLVELLSPAGRPVQLTTDLPRFWATSYADVRRDLRGRYPKHPWPEDPAAAAPTRRARPRGN